MGLELVMTLWVLLAQTTTLQCREAACRPAPGAEQSRSHSEHVSDAGRL